jgi:nitric oxide reductase NorE protein
VELSPPISATAPPSAGRASGAGAQNRPRPTPHVPGEAGVWVFILGDLAAFGLLFGVWMYYRGKEPALFADSQLEVHRTFGAINTLLLLTSSLCVITAVRAVRAQMRRVAQAAIGFALVCGVGFLLNKVLEWTDLVGNGHGPTTNNFFLYFFVLTGLHAFHVVVGMGVLTALLRLSRKPSLSKGQFAFVEGGACFWHMVDLIWVVLFALLYLMH